MNQKNYTIRLIKQLNYWRIDLQIILRTYRILDIYYLMALQSYKLYENSPNVKIPRKTAFRRKQNI